MPDYVPIQDLTIVGSVGDNDLFPMSDGSGAYAVRGSTIKSYAATDAAAARAAAQTAATAAGDSATAAGNAQSAAEAAQSAAEEAIGDAEDAIAAAALIAGTVNVAESFDWSPIDVSTKVDNEGVNYQTGLEISNTNCSRTSLLFVAGYSYLKYAQCVSTAQTSQHGLAFYGPNGASSSSADYISGVASKGGGSAVGYAENVVPVPEGAIYVRITLWKSLPQGFYIYGFSPMDHGTLQTLGVTNLSTLYKPGKYRSGAAYMASVEDLPADYDYDNGACNFFVDYPAFATGGFCTQRLVNRIGVTWYRTVSFNSSSHDWTASEWHRMPSEEDSKKITALEASELVGVPWEVGFTGTAVDYSDGSRLTNASCNITKYVDVSAYSKIKYAQCWSTAASSSHGIAFYSKKGETAYVSGVQSVGGASQSKYLENIVDVPEGAVYARFTMWADNEESFFVQGYPKNPPLSGLKLSLLGDSISSFAGYVPAGNDVYYTGSNHGINSVEQMWWKLLCTKTGMTPLVIDAWSGSSICYNFATDAAHSDKIPMCSDLRTGRLATQTEGPDIIIVAGGTNDWTYSDSDGTTTPLGDWTGRTAVDEEAVVDGTSTFMESYASMIHKLQTNYPNAIVVCASCFFNGRGTNLGITRVNDRGLTEADYNEAIERVCKIMGVPYLDIYNVGFSYQNFYPTFAEDSETTPTHCNAVGHMVIAKRFAEEVPKLVQQYFGPYLRWTPPGED